MKKKLSPKQTEELLNLLKDRFKNNMHRHKNIDWQKVETKLASSPGKLWSLYEMESSGGEPDIIYFDNKTEDYHFYDCSAESPKERRSLCYDYVALNLRKENKPKGSAMAMAEEMGIEVLNEEQYRILQQFGKFDTKTSSWIKTPEAIRKLGGAIFGDNRYNTVFIYHNGAESYYAARGFRGLLRL